MKLMSAAVVERVIDEGYKKRLQKEVHSYAPL
jgi:hypothetical protein